MPTRTVPNNVLNLNAQRLQDRCGQHDVQGILNMMYLTQNTPMFNELFAYFSYGIHEKRSVQDAQSHLDNLVAAYVKQIDEEQEDGGGKDIAPETTPDKMRGC